MITTKGILPWLGVLLLLLGAGCKSKPGGKSHAAVEITGHSLDEIRSTAVVVFAEHGYTLRTSLASQMVFERTASTGEKVKYGDWLNEGMMIQIKVRLKDMPGDTWLLQSDVYVVHDPTDPSFRSERRITTLAVRSYQTILDEVRNRLAGTTGN